MTNSGRRGRARPWPPHERPRSVNDYDGSEGLLPFAAEAIDLLVQPVNVEDQREAQQADPTERAPDNRQCSVRGAHRAGHVHVYVASNDVEGPACRRPEERSKEESPRSLASTKGIRRVACGRVLV